MAKKPYNYTHKVQIMHSVCSAGHYVTHITYLTLVFFQAHGSYGIAAGVLGVLTLVGTTVDWQLRTAETPQTEEE